MFKDVVFNRNDFSIDALYSTELKKKFCKYLEGHNLGCYLSSIVICSWAFPLMWQWCTFGQQLEQEMGEKREGIKRTTRDTVVDSGLVKPG